MPSDSGQHGRDRKNKVIPLGRHALVAEIEEKLLEARRFFSLHHYRDCERFVREVLKKDPQNSKAKALLDLTVIKLSAGKPLRRTEAPASPEPPAVSSSVSGAGEEIAPAVEGPAETAPANSSAREEAEEDRRSSTSSSSVSRKTSPSLDAVSPELSSQKDSLRERTISALVELFQSKEKSLANWRDPRFQEAEQEQLPAEKPVAEVKLRRGRREGKTAHPKPSPLVESAGSQKASESLPTPPEAVPSLPPRPKFPAPTPPANYQQLVARKFEERSEDLRKSEIKTVTIAQIKKYLYQEEYELCAQELENIRMLFPENEEIQIFVENTFRRLTELQRIKNLELQAKELMGRATRFYQEGKLPESLNTANEILRVLPNHQQAKDFVAFVNKRFEKERKKTVSGEKTRYCWYCGVAVDRISRFCFHCGQPLT